MTETQRVVASLLVAAWLYFVVLAGSRWLRYLRAKAMLRKTGGWRGMPHK